MSLSHIDLTNPDVFQQGTPYEWFRQLRAEDPVYWHEEEEGPGFWNITKYEDLRHVSRNPLLFSSEVGGTQMRDPTAQERTQMGERDPNAPAPTTVSGAMGSGGPTAFPIMLNMDPPRHVMFRRVIQRSFTPGWVPARR